MQKRQHKLIAAALAGAALLTSALTINAMTLTQLLVEKGVISEAEAAGVSGPSTVSEGTLIALLVDKGVLSAAEADALAVTSTPAPAPAAAPTSLSEPETFAAMSNTEIMERAGTEGIETIMWLVMRGALSREAKLIHKHYHAPISNTGAGVLVLENTHSS